MIAHDRVRVVFFFLSAYARVIARLLENTLWSAGEMATYRCSVLNAIAVGSLVLLGPW